MEWKANKSTLYIAMLTAYKVQYLDESYFTGDDVTTHEDTLSTVIFCGRTWKQNKKDLGQKLLSDDTTVKCHRRLWVPLDLRFAGGAMNGNSSSCLAAVHLERDVTPVQVLSSRTAISSFSKPYINVQSLHVTIT